MKNKYIIVDIRDGDFMKDKDGKMKVYDTFHDAAIVCGMYEFENAWICELLHNHKESDIWQDRKNSLNGI